MGGNLTADDGEEEEGWLGDDVCMALEDAGHGGNEREAGAKA